MTEAVHDDQTLDTLNNLTAPCQCPFRCLIACFKPDKTSGTSPIQDVMHGAVSIFGIGAPDTDAPLLPRRLGTSQPPPQLRM